MKWVNIPGGVGGVGGGGTSKEDFPLSHLLVSVILLEYGENWIRQNVMEMDWIVFGCNSR